MRKLAIQNSLKCTGTLQIFIDPHWYFILDTGLILRSIELFIYIQTEENINHYLAVVLNYAKSINMLYWPVENSIPKNNDRSRL
jgi:hypothetical protein